ncbi:hypothetical protein COC42_03695 [Sphingomonas spermidinifaciens]|uniref:DUF2934 domain-containing protein n=1 Tax=Sphingomonas spermidinifaciens TaxID=1141889 RepID=A0A2A4B9Q3_9SPHN|nr:DUF2934 domain-containing protein [Sphingomonas spermidinifaciens]PCD04682.1 hypothetical protein COC42_03695 [Sphingomonas spermidinifaciens]
MNDKPASDRDARVAERAYAKWEAEGRPAGRHDDHWHDAAREIDADPIAGAVPEAIPIAEREATAEPSKPKRAPKKVATGDAPTPVRKRAPAGIRPKKAGE